MSLSSPLHRIPDCRSSRLLVLLLPVVLLTGCQSGSTLIRTPSLLLQDPGQLVGRPRYERNLAKIVTIWEPSQGKDMNGLNSRGFAGQILFFGAENESGARVRGKVLISLYDDYQPDLLEEPTLLHRFEFDADAWEMHRGEGTLGHSYSVFIPYVNAENKNQVNCALKVEIQPDGGLPVSSRETEVLLPGRNTVSHAAARTRGFVENRNHREINHSTPQRKTQLETMSIPLPGNSSGGTH